MHFIPISVHLHKKFIHCFNVLLSSSLSSAFDVEEVEWTEVIEGWLRPHR